MSSRAFHRVTVLKGGPSAEREVSLASAAEVCKALRAEGYEVTEVDAGPDLVADLRASNPDVVYNSLHGRWGEDGCVQGLLEWLQIPYTHSGVFSSALAMDKEKSKDVLRMAGLPMMDSMLVSKADAMAAHPMQPPYVIKPFNEGSSVGVYLVDENANGPAKLDDDMPEIVMVEAFAPGREMTTAVMGDRALGVTDIITDGWYDYDAKYKAGGSRHEIPANIPTEIFDACLEYALRAHNALGCRGLTRTDFRWDESKGLDGLIILEVNTQPGFTPTSLAPEQAEHAGISFGELVTWITEDASCQR
ncbi:D-alanine--D-alanine ligase [Amylibacter sp. IMCC11727]|uniref:D-alanine--D-alanine ligase n=1 Tax=Amylibacter sp. IMCC11727 TaxID=3039851 RepID=UPI00244DC356|nr:D-alanine--D-alanine ligase [Amylibacter sp. IMCC11727]WGI21112.1 D-alanine--D-alanine ligase [Amylibacter sp. IMCC11727]